MNGKPFFIATLFTAAFLFACAMAVQSFTSLVLPKFLYGVIAFYTILNLFLFQLLKKGHAISANRFVTTFQGAVGIKLLSSIALVFAGLYFFPENRNTLAIGVMIIYFFFTSVLVRYML
ncbi:MAG: hypothetical protein ACPGED_00535, partial [Flavobacteriales bacterium]